MIAKANKGAISPANRCILLGKVGAAAERLGQGAKEAIERSGRGEVGGSGGQGKSQRQWTGLLQIIDQRQVG